MIARLIIATVLFSIIFSCNHHPENAALELNNGEKWNVNAEMMPFLTTSKTLIAEFEAGSDKDYKSLAAQLKESNKQLISSCTMTGKSHEELHKWLHPYMGFLDELDEAKNEQEAGQVFEKIKTSFDTFGTYFQ